MNSRYLLGAILFILFYIFILIVFDNKNETNEKERTEKRSIWRKNTEEKRIDRELRRSLSMFDWNELDKLVGRQLYKKKISVLYFCDKKACGEDCPNPISCDHTTDPLHAVNFEKVVSNNGELLYIIEKEKE